MNFILNLLAVILTMAAACVFLASLIINLVRALKVNKLIKLDPEFVEGKVVEIIKHKNQVFVRVEYTSKVNMLKFSELFQLTYKEFNDQYYEGQAVKVYYPKTNGVKNVTCFPTYLEGQKMGISAGQLFTDILGGNRVGIITCLVDPLTNEDFILTKILKMMEQIVFKIMDIKSILKKGEYYD